LTSMPRAAALCCRRAGRGDCSERGRELNFQRRSPRTLVTVRSTPFFIDLGVAACALAVFFAIVSTGVYWFQKPIPVVPISSAISALPLYAFYSIVRMTIAYFLSLAFAVAYGYIAAYNPRIEPWMVAVLDILQSVPVLSFLPPVVLAMVSLIPGHQIGIEMAVILLIFTGQVWNLAFSFYSSLKTIPREMQEASRIFRHSGWQRFWQLEMPFRPSAWCGTRLSPWPAAGSALIFCETFTMGDRNFQLPGLGSYIQSATYEGNVSALLAGIVTVILIVVRDRSAGVASAHCLERQIQIRAGGIRRPGDFADPRTPSSLQDLPDPSRPRLGPRGGAGLPASCAQQGMPCGKTARRYEVRQSLSAAVGGALAGAIAVCWAPCRPCSCSGTSRGLTAPVARGAGATFLRVNVALLLLPCGRSGRSRHRPQSQAGARGAAHRANHGFGAGNSLLSDFADGPGENRRRPGHRIGCIDVARHAMVHPLQRDRRRHVHSFRPARGGIAVSLHALAALDQAHPPRHLSLPHHGNGHSLRGAWNASVMAEYSHVKGQTLSTIGLGAQIDAASDSGRFSMLLLATIFISLMVVTMNRLVWRRLYHLAETRFKLDG